MAITKRKLSPWFLLAFLLLLAWVSWRIVGVFVNYVLGALFIAFLTHPLYDRLQKWVRFPSVAALLMVFAVTVVLFVPLALLTVQLVDELVSILPRLDGAALRETFDHLIERVFGRVPDPDGASFFDVVMESINAMLSGLATRMVGAIAEAVIGLFIMLYILYYAYRDGHRFVEWVRGLLPLHEAHRDLLLREVENVTKAVMYGHVLTSLIQAVLGGLGFLVFGVPNVVFWSVIMFILALLPIVGPPLVWAPWGVYFILQGDMFQGIGLLVYSAIMVSTLDNIIRPKLVGNRARVHPTVVLLGLVGGVVLFGFMGLFLGPLILSIFVVVLNVYRKEFVRQFVGDPGI